MSYARHLSRNGMEIGDGSQFGTHPVADGS